MGQCFACAYRDLCFFGQWHPCQHVLPFSLLGISIFNTVSQGRRAKYFIYPLLVLIGCAFLFLIFLLVTEKGEASNAIKFGHLPSYWQLFNDHPEYLLIGQGPATSFYTEGFHEMTLQTEWTYLELLRNYGLLSLPILGVFAYPWCGYIAIAMIPSLKVSFLPMSFIF